ncbi:MAG: hypothetical protein ACI8P3_003417 [Saprospiraceae bacterium]|jgi:hypothetical protein
MFKSDCPDNYLSHNYGIKLNVYISTKPKKHEKEKQTKNACQKG